GMFLVPAVVLAFAARRRWRDAGIALVAGVLILVPWQLWTAAHAHELVSPVVGKYGSYSKWFVDGVRDGGLGYLLTVFRENSEFSGTFLAGTFGLSTAPMAVRSALVLVVTAIFVLGTRAVWRHTQATALFLVFYVPVVLVWPFPPDRFYWGVWPLLVFAFALGVRSVARMPLVAPRWRQIAFSAVVVTLGVMYMRPQTFGIARPWVWDIQGVMADRSRAIVQWVNRNAGPNDVIASEDDTMVYLYTGRLTLPLGAFTPREHVNPQSREFAEASVDTLLQQYPVRWLMPITWMGINASNDLARRHPTRVAFRQALPLGAVFERLPTRGADQ
ncbi:MAG: hypothetical protein AB1762_07130, partial [Gemmatimonadota bacterium]